MTRRWKGKAAKRLVAFADNAATIEQAIDRVGNRLLAGVRCPPTDLDAIMRRLDVVSVEETESVVGSGALVEISDGRFKILVSPQSPFRTRFTTAHELAHAVLRELAKGGRGVAVRSSASAI